MTIGKLNNTNHCFNRPPCQSAQCRYQSRLTKKKTLAAKTAQFFPQVSYRKILLCVVILRDVWIKLEHCAKSRLREKPRMICPHMGGEGGRVKALDQISHAMIVAQKILLQGCAQM